MPRFTLAALLLVALLAPAPTVASEKRELLELKNTIVNLVDALVKQGVLTEEQATALQHEAAEKARAAGIEAGESVDDTDTAGKKVVRVPYVPEFVKDEIREKVRQDLRKDVTDDVVAKAKAERWGTADALPDWVNRFTWYGQARFRYESTFYDDENQPFTYPNFLAINNSQSISGPNTFFNTTEDRERLRFRLRLGFIASVTDSLNVGARITTGNESNPLSMNQTLGESFGPYNMILDWAYIDWRFDDDQGDELIKLWGGRFERPFLATDLVWDNDVALEGIAGQFNYRFGASDDLAGRDDRNNRVYLTLGGFPLDNDELAFDDSSSNDKYMLGAQLGFSHEMENQSTFDVAVSVYDYVNIVGKFNPDGPFGSSVFDWTAPGFSTRGNTMYPIKFNAAGDPILFGLASDFTMANITGRARFSHFAPIFVTLTGDFVKNVAFDDEDVFERTGVRVSDRTNGWQARLDLGWDQITRFGQWNFYAAYKYLQRDATLDAYVDSNFHSGGTDAKGFLIGTNIGIADNTWVHLRYFSADEIDLAPLGIDILQLDLLTQF